MANQSSNDKDQASTDGPDRNVNLSRRTLFASAAAMAASTALPGCGSSNSPVTDNRPNILFILVDQLRFPMHFPAGVTSAAGFLQRFMPNTYSLWQRGVKFANHQTASTMCTPSRGVLVTGLYSHQTWCATTITSAPGSSFSLTPPLLPGYPTYGKLLQSAGYATPYIGKWHLSVPHQADGQGALSLFGFQAGATTTPDPVGWNLQGTYGDRTNLSPGGPFYSDGDIADEASNLLSQKKLDDKPWCMTVCFQNPHDQEWFPAGTEFQTFTDLFNNVGGLNPSGYQPQQNYSIQQCAEAVAWANNVLANPPSIGYPAIPPNWESLATLQANKPAWQNVCRQFFQLHFGGVDETIGTTGFSIAAYPDTTTYPGFTPPAGNLGIGHAPYSYWQRSADLYTQIQTIVDQKIGQVVNSLPPDVAAKTIIVFTSDHGDYAGSHGMVAGKEAMYKEAIHMPLIFVDPTGQFTGDIGTVRTQLTSAVDLMPMLVSIAYGGSRSWMQGEYAAIYSNRYDMFPILRSATVAGRNYALFASDETLALKFDFATAPDPITGLKTPYHILGLITPQSKLGVYSNWTPPTVAPDPVNQQYEYYDYSTPNGALELANTYATDPNAPGLKTLLLNQFVPNELEATLPGSFGVTQAASKVRLLSYLNLNLAGIVFSFLN